MDNKNIIEKMLDYQRIFRKSYLEELESDDKYKVLNLLANKSINDSYGTYNVEKEYIKNKKVLDVCNDFKSLYYDEIDENLKEIWKTSVAMLINCESSAIDIVKYTEFNIQVYKELLKIGNVADKNREKLEFDKLKIKLMNKKRRQ